jgi:DNA-binding NarL/FixJ family response regulator
VSDYVATGHSNKTIAAELCLSLNSVSTYIRRARQKLGAASRTDLIRALGPPVAPPAAQRLPPEGLPRQPTMAPVSLLGLSVSERDVVLGLLSGLRYCEIARQRRTSRSTIACQVKAACRKLGVSSRYELAAAVFGYDGSAVRYPRSSESPK